MSTWPVLSNSVDCCSYHYMSTKKHTQYENEIEEVRLIRDEEEQC